MSTEVIPEQILSGSCTLNADHFVRRWGGKRDSGPAFWRSGDGAAPNERDTDNPNPARHPLFVRQNYGGPATNAQPISCVLAIPLAAKRFVRSKMFLPPLVEL